MDSKKSTAVSVCAFLSILLFAVIGSCFMTYMYEYEKVVIVNPPLYIGNGISVTDKDGNNVNKLTFSEVKLGLKPVTGELDSETKVPVTVNDQNGSEGIFAKITIKNNVECSIIIKNLQVSGNDKLDLKKERENIWFSIDGVKDSTKNFKDEEITLASLPVNGEGREFTILFWFSSVASEEFESTTISFDVHIK